MKDKNKATALEGAAQIKSHQNPTDMSAAAQCARVLEWLKADGQTTYSLRAKGISHPAMRVKELAMQGYLIASSRVTAVDSDGFAHNGVARYRLIDRELDLVDQMEAAAC